MPYQILLKARDDRGFSLIELMVVVAIIGILATLAIPQYQKFSARSRQTYAKSELSGLFTVEKSFQAEYATYSTWINAIGFAPDGMVSPYNGASHLVPVKPRYYNIGVGPYVGGPYPCVALWPSDLPPIVSSSIRFSTSYVGNSDAASAIIEQAWAGFIVGGVYSLSQICDASTFVATALGDLYKRSTPQYDVWTINQNRVLKNEQSGL